MTSERERPSSPDLPPELTAFLRGQQYGALIQETNLGTVLVVKAPRHELAYLAGLLTIGIDHELYDLASAPVIRLVASLYAVPDDAVTFETFVNVGDPQQRREYRLLAQQDELPVVGYDEDLHHALAKHVRIANGEEIAAILHRAEELYAATSPERIAFDATKQQAIERTDLRPSGLPPASG